MRIAVLTAQIPFVDGGAERLASGLTRALGRNGHEVDLLRIPFHDSPELLLDNLLVSRLLNFQRSPVGEVDLLIALKFPAYLARHTAKLIWVIHQYRSVYDLWNHPNLGFAAHPRGAVLRAAVQAADRQAFGEAQGIYSISRTVSKRLASHSGVAAAPIFTPPEDAELFETAPAEDFLYLPSRITRTKRQDLAIRALSFTRNPVKLVLAGANSDHAYFDEVDKLVEDLGLRKRVQFLGQISGEKSRDLYARCLAVVFCPLDEDYGYVTLEGMLASKPVITSRDAGEPAMFVGDGDAGLVTNPEPQSIAMAMDELWEDRQKSAMLGKSGNIFYKDQHIDWNSAVKRLLA